MHQTPNLPEAPPVDGSTDAPKRKRHILRWILIVIVAIVAIDIMSELAGTTNPITGISPTTTTPDGSSIERDSIPAAAVRATLSGYGINTFDASSDADMDSAGEAVCDVARSLASDGELSDVDKALLATTAADSIGVSTQDGARIAGAFAGAYCPEVLGS